MTSTVSIKTFEGIPCLVPNVTEQHDKSFYVSYNNYDTGIYGSDTTAIVLNDMTRFTILNGDHRKPLKGLTYAEAIEYAMQHSEQINKFSDDFGPRNAWPWELDKAKNQPKG